MNNVKRVAHPTDRTDLVDHFSESTEANGEQGESTEIDSSKSIVANTQPTLSVSPTTKQTKTYHFRNQLTPSTGYVCLSSISNLVPHFLIETFTDRNERRQ